MKTKNWLVLTLTLLISLGAYAQKGSVTKADSYFNKEDLASAKAEIDVAITIEKNIPKSKTWFVRGKIYQNIATSTDAAVKSLDADAVQKAVEAYEKVMGMEKETNPNHLLSSTNLEVLWGSFVNDGGTSYGEGDYEGALVAFENALLVKPSDSVTLLYAGVTAQQAGQIDKTLDYYYKLVAADLASLDVYSTLIFLERSENKNDEKALELVQAAKVKFPEEKKFGQEEISLLLAMDKIEEAKTKLIKAIEVDPANANLHLNLGVLHDNLGSAKMAEGKIEEAKEAFNIAKQNYINAIKVDPENYIGNYNAGVIYVNLAKEYYDEVRDMNLRDYDRYGAAKLEKADAILKEGLPYMEKATDLQPDDVSGLTALKQMYTQLKMFDKAEALMDRIDALEGGE